MTLQIVITRIPKRHGLGFSRKTLYWTKQEETKLHSFVRINYHLLIWPRSRFIFIPLSVPVQIYYSSQRSRNHKPTHTQCWKKIASSHFACLLTQSYSFLKTTKAEFLMNYADRVDEDLVEANQSFIFDERRSILHSEKAKKQTFGKIPHTAHC